MMQQREGGGREEEKKVLRKGNEIADIKPTKAGRWCTEKKRWRKRGGACVALGLQLSSG